MSWAILLSLFYRRGARSIKNLDKLLKETQLTRELDVKPRFDSRAHALNRFTVLFLSQSRSHRHLLNLSFGDSMVFGEIKDSN